MKVTVVAYPVAKQFGQIEVPDELSDNEIKKYIRLHWKDVILAKADLDYRDVPFEINSKD